MELTALKNLDLPEACLHFGNILGLEQPVAQGVLFAALEDEDYARNLLLARRSPELLNMLLKQRTNYKSATIQPNDRNHEYSNLELMGKLGKSLLKWGATGFSTVTNEVYAKRLAACHA